MKLISVIIGSCVLLGASASMAQVKDGRGNDLRVGQPSKPAPDLDGGLIGTGKAAKCVLDSDPPSVCTFYPRNGNGSFAIDVNGMAYYADKTDPDEIDVDYDNRARMVPQGTFTRSKRNSACWVQAPSRKICIY